MRKEIDSKWFDIIYRNFNDYLHDKLMPSQAERTIPANKTLELAASIMGYCGGDSWERECTQEDRGTFAKLHESIKNYYDKKVKGKNEIHSREEAEANGVDTHPDFDSEITDYADKHGK